MAAFQAVILWLTQKDYISAGKKYLRHFSQLFQMKRRNIRARILRLNIAWKRINNNAPLLS